MRPRYRSKLVHRRRLQDQVAYDAYLAFSGKKPDLRRGPVVQSRDLHGSERDDAP